VDLRESSFSEAEDQGARRGEKARRPDFVHGCGPPMAPIRSYYHTHRTEVQGAFVAALSITPSVRGVVFAV